MLLLIYQDLHNHDVEVYVESHVILQRNHK